MARTLTVYLAADTSKFRAGMKSAANAVDGPDGLHGKVNGLANKFTDMLGPALLGAGIAAGALAVKLGVDGVQAAIADQAAVEKLTTVMSNLGLAQDVSATLAQIDAMQRLYGVSEDVLRPAFQRLVVSIGDSSKALDVVKIAMDVAQATGKPLETVVAALGKAYDGNTGGLSRLGAGLDKAILKTGDMDLITQALADRFGGSAAANAETYQGKINRLTIGFDELKESFGQGFLDGLTNADAGVGSLAQTMKDHEQTVKDFGKNLGDSLTTLLGIAGAISSVKTAFDEWTKQLGGWGDLLNKFVSVALNPVMEGLKTVLDTINKVKAAMASLNNVPATPSGPGNVDLLLPPKNSLPDGSYVGSTIGGGRGSSPIMINTTVNTGVGDPVAIAKAVNNILTQAGRRVGTAF